MFDIGVAELFVFGGTMLVLTLVWRAWRARWVRVSQEWRPALTREAVEQVLFMSFAAVPGAQWRPQADGSWIYTVRRVPSWAILLGLLTLPFGLLLLLVKETADLHVRLLDDGGGCLVRAVGRTPDATAQALDTWLARMETRTLSG